ncbi:MAG: acyl-CoA thioesterase II [Pseudomonadota bacterium]
MSKELDDLVNSLTLERLEENLFRGVVADTTVKRVYGGKVLGEAIMAAQQTAEQDRTVHSIHAYFLREADAFNPIIYDVERSRDGRSFSARRVTAIQYGRPIFILEASFHKEEDGMTYQTPMADVPPPSKLTRVSFETSRIEEAPPKIQRMRNIAASFEIRPLENASEDNSTRRIWVKTVDALPDDAIMHRTIMAYVSDFGLLWTVIASKGYKISNDDLMLASLDHAMWFHRPFRIDDWLLYECEAVSAASARGLAKGAFYTENGELVCTVMQEGLIRLLDKN